MRSRVGLGFDVHPFGAAPPLVLGGVEIKACPTISSTKVEDASTATDITPLPG